MDSVEALYSLRIKPLPTEERLRLMALIARDLAPNEAGRAVEQRSLLELEGLGARIWEGVDAGEYVRGLRDEWSDRP